MWVKLQKETNPNIFEELNSLKVEWNRKYPQDANLQLAQLMFKVGSMPSRDSQKQLERILNQYEPLDESMSQFFVNTCKQMIMFKASRE